MSFSLTSFERRLHGRRYISTWEIHTPAKMLTHFRWLLFILTRLEQAIVGQGVGALFTYPRMYCLASCSYTSLNRLLVTTATKAQGPRDIV